MTGLELEVGGIFRTLLIKAKNRYFGLLHTTPESPAIVGRRGTLGRAKSTAELVARVEETAIRAAYSENPDYRQATQEAQDLGGTSKHDGAPMQFVGWTEVHNGTGDSAGAAGARRGVGNYPPPFNRLL